MSTVAKRANSPSALSRTSRGHEAGFYPSLEQIPYYRHHQDGEICLVSAMPTCKVVRYRVQAKDEKLRRIYGTDSRIKCLEQ